ncbi:MAG: hypothetical protein AMXMBFR84_12460 [Candidatus Hydrogenedentota bacterium]
MKSAYELAMERLEKEKGPTKKLSDSQKFAIAEIDRKYDAKVAEKKLQFDTKIAAAAFAEVEGIRTELSSALNDIEDKREREKEAVWNQD